MFALPCHFRKTPVDSSSPSSREPRTAEFLRLYAAHSRKVWTYLLTMLPNRADAEEVFQDISVTLWEKFDDFTLGTNFAAWAFKISHFKIIKFRQRNLRRSKLFASDVLDLLDADMLAVDDSADAEYIALAECFSRLSAPDQKLIERRYQPGSSPQVLSEGMAVPVRRIYKELARIRSALLACIAERLAEGGSA